MGYDIQISGPESWWKLVKEDCAIVIDPLILRIGQFFLEGAPEDRDERDRRWRAIESDLGALATFFDLVVLRDRLSAFNYRDTYRDWSVMPDVLGSVLNSGGDKTLWHVDVEDNAYWEMKQQALEKLKPHLEAGAQIDARTQQDLLADLTALGYEWNPQLDYHPLPQDPGVLRTLQFLLGYLVFGGYAQQTGAPHVLASKRSRIVTAIGLSVSSASEDDVYTELARRFREAGDGWRSEELPWTPSFLPYLVSQMKDRFREGPDVLLALAKDLRGTPAVARYRTHREMLLSQDAERSDEARAHLTAMADQVARDLGSTPDELKLSRTLVVEVLPGAVGGISGSAAGAAMAGLPGMLIGGVAGAVASGAAGQASKRLWGWFVDKLPFVSARKLLSRSARAELDLRDRFGEQLYTVWTTPRADAAKR